MASSYKIVFKASVEKDLRRIDRSQVSRVISAIQDLSLSPYPQQSRKLVGAEKSFRLRVGDYRIVYSVITETNEIEIQRIGHRKDIYR